MKTFYCKVDVRVSNAMRFFRIDEKRLLVRVIETRSITHESSYRIRFEQ